MSSKSRVRAIVGVFGIVTAGIGVGCMDDDDDDDDGDDQPGSQVYQRVDLVADQAGAAARVDPALVNAWGLAYGPDTAFWVANEGTGTTTVYDGDGAPALAAIQLGEPVTGVVFNPGDELAITVGQSTAPAVFVYATVSGKLIGWSDAVSPEAGVVAFDGSTRGAAYTGLAITSDARTTRLYAANFSEHRVDVFDGGFRPIQAVLPMFVDPGLPAGYAPFGIQTVGDRVYIAYALQSPNDPGEEVLGAGLGVVSAFQPDGRFDRRIATAGSLNAPWAIARAPAGFGRFAGALLVGNFGDGRITAFDDSGRMLGQLENDGQPIAIEGLWGLVPGNGRLAGHSDALYFAAGPGEELHGLFGRIEARRGSGGDDDDDDDGPYDDDPY